MRLIEWPELGQRPLLFPALAFYVGAFIGGSRPPALGPPWACCALAAALAGGALWARRRVGSHLLLLGAWLAGGASLAEHAAEVEVPFAVPATPSSTYGLEGVLESVEPLGGGASGSSGRSLLLRVSRVSAPGQPLSPARFGVLLADHRGPHARSTPSAEVSLEPGQRCRLTAKLKLFEPAANPGERDRATPALRRGLPFRGAVASPDIVALTPPSSYRRWLRSTHQRLLEAILAVAPSPRSAALLAALTTGMRALGPELEESFARSGLAHVLSVSGLHVTAIALALLFCVRRALALLPFSRSRDPRRLAVLFSLPWVWGYVLFTGSQAPALRSAIMVTVVMLGMALWRRADPLNSLCAASILLTALDPASVAELSVQLSFVSVLGLILIAPAIDALWPRLPRSATEAVGRIHSAGRRVAAVLRQTLCASAAVTLSTFPLTASAFHRVSVAGLWVNGMALPLCAVTTLLAALAAACFVLSPALARPLLLGGAWACEGLIHLAELGGSWKWAAPELPALIPGGNWLWAAGLSCFALSRGPLRRAALLLPFTLVASFVPIWILPYQNGLEVTFLAVGQGDAAVLRSRGKTAVIDGGGVPGGADPGERVVLPFLRDAGVRHLDLMVLSHPHPDHGLGLAAVARALPPDHLWLSAETPGPLSTLISEAAKRSPEWIERGAPALDLGDARIEVLGPPSERSALRNVNDQSIVLRVVHGAVSFLLLGDVEAAGEAALRPVPATVVKAPHHGSRTSSSPALVEAMRPRYVVFCVGRQNRFGFPHREVVDRYLQTGARCFRTDLDGAVQFVSDGVSVRYRTFLADPESHRTGEALAGSP